MLVGRTDVPKEMTYRQAARKAVASCVSDFAAKGVVPDSFLVSLGLPRLISQRQVNELADGFGDAMREWKLNLVGGDTNEADDLVIDCTMLGYASDITPRDGARPGELVVVTGYFGLPSAGLKILLSGANANAEFKRAAVGSVLEPSPRQGLGVGISKYLSSSIDSSDGLATCLHTIAASSGVKIELSMLPYAKGVEKFARSNGYSPEELVLYGGEEYEIVGTIGRRVLSKAQHVAGSLGQELIVIGRTLAGSGVTLSTAAGEKVVENRGWVHLR